MENTYDFKDDILMMYRETRVLPRKIMKATLEKEGEAINLFEDIIIRGNQSGAFRVRDPFFAANMIVLELSLYSLRRWNLGGYTPRRVSRPGGRDHPQSDYPEDFCNG